MLYLDSSESIDNRVEDLLKQMTLREKIGQMCQYTGEPEPKDSRSTSGMDDLNIELQNAEEAKYAADIPEKSQLILRGEIGSFLKVPGLEAANYLQKVAEQSRLKIPLLIATDAIHGHGMYTSPSTIFPTQLGLAATFSPELAEKMAAITASEMRATGYHWTFSPNIEIVRDQRWGRTGETFGEDTLLSTEMGRAMVKGYQSNGNSEVLACAKHLVGGGEAFNGINGAEADISDRTLKSVYLPPFEACIKEGCFTLMPAHNSLNGIPCHCHRELLSDILRKEWGFSGFVVSDWLDIKRLHTILGVASSYKDACQLAVSAGIDVHMHGPDFLDEVKNLVDEGTLSEERIDMAVKPILEAKFRLGLFEKPLCRIGKS
jgi:beta-glucosidase